MKYIKGDYKYSDITEKIIKEAYYVYNELGYGFLEKIYENALVYRLGIIGLKVEQQYPINVYFEKALVGEYFADIVIENKVIVEVKAIEKLNQIHEVQLVNYLKATDSDIGLLINFGKKMDIKRKIHDI